MIIPARNEEHTIGALLASLANQSRTAEQIIVVDDDSTDETASVATRAGATVLSAPAVPEGWTGKTWACHVGSEAATGDVLVFLDADVTLSDDALARLDDEHHRSGGLVSVQPFHEVERPYERLSAVCNVVALMGSGAFTGPPWRPVTVAFGPCMVIGRVDYDRSGGHAHPEIRGHIVEDAALARRVQAIGGPVRVLAGRDVVSFRMYPEGVRQLVQGWTKMLGVGASRSRPGITVGVALWVTAALTAGRLGVTASVESITSLRAAGRSQPTARLRPTARVGRAARGRSSATSGVVYGAFGLQMWWMMRRVGRFGIGTASMFPVPLVAFVALFVRSALLGALRRPVRWRGRKLVSR